MILAQSQSPDFLVSFRAFVNKFKSACCISILAVVSSTPAISAEHDPLLDRSLFAIGGGVSYNKDEDNEFGFQIFGAYELSQVNLMEGVDSAVEFGIMDFGFSEDDTGIWISYAVDGAIDDQFGWLAQVGWLCQIVASGRTRM